MKTPTEELRASIWLIDTAECENTVMTEAAYALGMVHALRITYMLGEKYCDSHAEEIGRAKDRALERIRNRKKS